MDLFIKEYIDEVILMAVYRIKPAVRVDIEKLDYKKFTMKNVSQNQRLKCDKCNYSTFYYGNLKTHWKFKHSRNKMKFDFILLITFIFWTDLRFLNKSTIFERIRYSIILSNQ